MNVLFLITARGGSRGVPKKNIRSISGLPLIAYKIISAQKTKCDHKKILLSTDSTEIADVARAYEVDVPFKRPARLASDTAPSLDVILHAMEWVEANDPTKYDALFLLEPSSPFGTYKDFEAALDLLKNPEIQSVVSVHATSPNTLYIVPLSENGSLSRLVDNLKKVKKLRRQDFRLEYTPSGALYCARWDFFKANKTFYGERTYPVIQDDAYALEIDTMRDLEYAQFLVDKKYIDISFWR